MTARTTLALVLGLAVLAACARPVGPLIETGYRATVDGQRFGIYFQTWRTTSSVPDADIADVYNGLYYREYFVVIDGVNHRCAANPADLQTQADIESACERTVRMVLHGPTRGGRD